MAEKVKENDRWGFHFRPSFREYVDAANLYDCSDYVNHGQNSARNVEKSLVQPARSVILDDIIFITVTQPTEHHEPNEMFQAIHIP
jgi:hypothetical protein